MGPGNFFYDKLITHGWQFPVRLLVKYHRFFNNHFATSQDGQDMIVLGLLNNKRNGTFVDLGGSNGVKSSNTYYLENKFGWEGLCIEANPRFYKNLVKNRNCKTLFSCVAGENKKVYFNNDGATGSIDESGTAMDAVPLSQILKSQNMPSIIDYLSLDVEGYEEEILIDFPFDKYRFNVMTIERPSDALHDKLLTKGYKLHAKLEPDGFWVDNVYVYEDLEIDN
ncbi:MAG: FkbM family methyltransferase [Reichenbachiella sp.]